MRDRTVSPLIVERWERLANQPGGKFQYLQEWAEDPSCAKMQYNESHEIKQSDYSDKQYQWLTKFDIYSMKGGFLNPLAKEYCDALISKAKSRPHEDKKYRDDPRFTQYRVLFLGRRGEGQRAQQAAWGGCAWGGF